MSRLREMEDYQYFPLLEKMVREQLKARGIRNERVLEAFQRVPRHFFVPRDKQSEAFEDHPVSIGEGQTISQPYIVALMTETLTPQPTQRVLEIGTGSGYQTAILCELYKEVYSTERIEVLSRHANEVLQQIGYKNYQLKIANGSLGWRDHAPYDAIMVTCGSPHVPEPLIEQLSDGGKMIVPVGGANRQDLLLITKRGDHYETMSLGDVRFVPMIGEYGWGTH